MRIFRARTVGESAKPIPDPCALPLSSTRVTGSPRSPVSPLGAAMLVTQETLFLNDGPQFYRTPLDFPIEVMRMDK